jgi:hypothetical protein
MSQSDEQQTELLLQDLLEAWGASQDCVNQNYSLSDAHHDLPQLIRKTALRFSLTESDVKQFLQTRLSYHTTITLDYAKLTEQFVNLAAAKNYTQRLDESLVKGDRTYS